MGFARPYTASISPALFGGHLLAVMIFHVAAAMLFGWRQDRPWAATAFTLPVLLAILPLAWVKGVLIVGAVVIGALLVVAAWTVLPLGNGAPVASAGLGAALGAELIRFRVESVQGFAAAGLGELLRLGLVGIVLFALALAAGRLPIRVRRPSARFSGALVLLGCIASVLLVPISRGTEPPRPPAGAARVADGGPPVVLIVLDTVRADHLKSYGYKRDTMPHLEDFGKYCVRVERAISNGPSSLPSHGSLFTGVYPPRHGAHEPFVDDPDPPSYAYPLSEEFPTLATLLRESGYWTVGLSANFGTVSGMYGLDRGFHAYSSDPAPGYQLKLRTPWRVGSLALAPLAFLDRLPLFSDAEFFGLGVPYLRAKHMTTKAVEVLSQTEQLPFFLFVNYFDAHNPYYPPKEYLDHYPGRSWKLTTGRLANQVTDDVISGRRDLTIEEREHLTALYDGELAYLDSQLEPLFQSLLVHPRWEDMLVIITSDHGEALGEHRSLGHATSLYDPMTRVPLFIKPPANSGAPPVPSVLPGAIQSVDLFATILEHTRVQIPEGIDGLAWGVGRDAAYAWAYKHMRRAIPYPDRYSQELRSVEKDWWKLIESTTHGRELYDLENDPSELENLAEEDKGRVAELSLLFAPRVGYSPTQREKRQEESEEALRQLRSLGYVQ